MKIFYGKREVVNFYEFVKTEDCHKMHKKHKIRASKN
jgi:hypothetical protein